MLRRLNIGTKLALVIAVPLVAIVGAAAVAWPTFEAVRINGDKYQDLAETNELIADVLPPPSYAVESYLAANQIANELSSLSAGIGTAEQSDLNIARSIEAISAGRASFDERHDYWQTALDDEELRTLFLDLSWSSGVEFFVAVDERFLPAVATRDLNAAITILNNEVRPSFEEHQRLIDQVVTLARQELAAQESDARDLIRSRLTILAIVLGAIIVLAVALGVAVIRAISRPVKQLTAAAYRAAEEELPRVVYAIQNMGADDDALAIPGLDEFGVDSSDELADLAAAFNTVQQTAVKLASEQARIRRNVAEMFVNLGRRNQSLLNRTLSFISELERTERDPETLDDLFRLDHLTTRMRRNAESLLVLAGSEPARTWTKPVELGNVVRAALSEIESYDRVEFHDIEPARVRGNAIADVAHLLAELIENATVFSPPTSRVRVVGRKADHGYVITVIDQGIGMSPPELAEANRRLDEVARLDLAPTKVLGLYVVGRLAARHGIRATFVDSGADGLTVQVELPLAIVEIDVESQLDPGEPSNTALRISAPLAPRPTYVSEPVPPLPPLPQPTFAAAPAPPAPSPVSAQHPATQHPEFDDAGPPRLQRRVRGAHLGDIVSKELETGPAEQRSPDETRTSLASFQAGVTMARETEHDLAAEAEAAAAPGPTPALEPVGARTAGTLGASGLRRRVRGAQLPDTGPVPERTEGIPVATADDVKARLSSFQSGVHDAIRDAEPGS